MCNDEQREELEVLRSIYADDAGFFVEISERVFQFKFGEDGASRSFVLQISWSEEYPNDAPATCSLDDVFYNKHLTSAAKSAILDRLTAEAQDNIGMAMTFTLVEFVRDHLDELLAAQPESHAVNQHSSSHTDNAEGDQDNQKADKSKKLQMTKAQKRRMWEKGGAVDERERGWNWVDVVKHLSQTGGNNDR